MTNTILILLMLAIAAWIILSPIRKARRELKRSRALNALIERFFAIQNRRHDMIESAGFQPRSEEYQTLLQEEIEIRLAFGEFDREHIFLEPVSTLLAECTDRGFVECIRADLHTLRIASRFST